MNILLIGSGAREHAIARAIKRSKAPTHLFCFGSSRNPGIQELAAGYTVGSMIDAKMIAAWAHEQKIDWAIVGPEQPLEAGVVDELFALGIPSIGPMKKMAHIETSKSFARDLMTEYDIGTHRAGSACPKYKYFTSMVGVDNFIESLDGNYVVKADGLMGGKGVKVSGDHLTTIEEGIAWCEELIKGGKTFLIEEKLMGQEFSLMSFSDGKNLAHMPAVQDHKRAFDGDEGPNTGGMGSYSAADHRLPFLTEEDISDAQSINEATVAALADKYGEGYKGILYGGFIATKNGVKLIEYNARFGDPESLNVLSIIESDFIDLCNAIIYGRLHQGDAHFAARATVCKYVVPEGYPDKPAKGQPIDVSQVVNQASLYLGAVDVTESGLVETGSRTAAVVAVADTISEAEKIAEAEVKRISGPLFHRSDVGTDALMEKRLAMMTALRG